MARLGAIAVMLLALSGCNADEPVVGWSVQASEPRWVVPSAALPGEAPTQAANNNVSITLFEDRLFMGWRTAPSHFASEHTRMHVVSSPDLGESWDHEASFQMGTDLREPLLYEAGGQLLFSFFEAGANAAAFEPRATWRTVRYGLGDWAEPEEWGELGEVPWEVVSRGDERYLTTYLGNHYEFGQPGDVDVRFFRSTDGTSWSPVGEQASVYHGGGSEAAFQFDDEGGLWAALRNEDGDDTGWGTLLCHAPADALGDWDCPDTSDPERYDSPRMFRHEGEIYLLARRDVDGPYDQGHDELSFSEQQIQYLLAYSLRPKGFALYRIDREAAQVVQVMELPGCGDTAFPSVVPLDDHRFLVANYTSPLNDPDISWLDAQSQDAGTALYLMELEFVETELIFRQ